MDALRALRDQGLQTWRKKAPLFVSGDWVAVKAAAVDGEKEAGLLIGELLADGLDAQWRHSKMWQVRIRSRGCIVKLEEDIDFTLVKPIAEAQSPRRRMPAMDPPAEVRKKWQEEAAEVPVHVQGQLDKVVNQVGMMQRKMNEHCERTAPAFDALKHTQTTLDSKISELDAERS